MCGRLSVLPNRLRGSDLSEAAWLAGAMISHTLITLIASEIFARLLR
jgi:hypothetical protein